MNILHSVYKCTDFRSQCALINLNCRGEKEVFNFNVYS